MNFNRFFLLINVCILTIANVNAEHKIYDQTYVTYTAPSEKNRIIVFTDITCGWCQKLHKQIPDLNASGITVKYLPYPRGGIDSNAYKKMTYIYCADDPNRQLTRAMANFIIEKKECANTVKEIYLQANVDELVKGTPALYVKNDDEYIFMGGYLSTKKIVNNLNLEYEEASDAERAAFAAINFSEHSIPPTYYQANTTVSHRSLPTNELSGYGSFHDKGVLVATSMAINNDDEWIGKKYKGQSLYYDRSVFTKIAEVMKYDTKKIKSKYYRALVPTKIYMAPDIKQKSVFEAKPNFTHEMTFEYDQQGIKWLGFIEDKIKYFILAENLQIMK